MALEQRKETRTTRFVEVDEFSGEAFSPDGRQMAYGLSHVKP